MAETTVVGATLGAAWAKVLDAIDSDRKGDLVANVAPGAEFAYVAAPAPGEFFGLSLYPQDVTLPAYKDLYARVAGGAVGPVNIYGQLVTQPVP